VQDYRLLFGVNSIGGAVMSKLCQAAVRVLTPLLLLLYFFIPCAWCQDSGDQGTIRRGDRGEISVSVRDASGQVINAPATVKLYQNGIPSDQMNTSHGRAFFIPRTLGDFTIVVEAAGYKSAQKDISLPIPEQAEVDIYLQRDLAPGESTGVPGKPILAPKAQEALAKGSQALRDGKLTEAQKYLSEALKLAPSNPDVLYAQGMLYMKQNNWASAESVLQKSNQIAPNQSRVLAALGMTLCNGGKYGQAIPVLQKSIELEPTSGWEADWALTKAYYYHEEYELALKTAEQTHTATHATVPQVELLFAQCLTATGQYGDSAKVLQDLLKNNPKAPEAATARRWLDKLSADGKIGR
jgi:Flp pilus assembly protein TadD